MAPHQPTNDQALPDAHREALELLAATSRILAATAMLHTTRPGSPRRTILNNLDNDIKTASHNLYRLRCLTPDIG